MKRTARSRLEWLLVAPWRLALLVALALAAPVLVVNETAVRGSEARLAEERRAETLAAAERSADLVDVWIYSLRQRMAGSVEVPDLKAATRAKDLPALASLVDGAILRVLPSGAQAKDVVRLSVVGADGRIMYGFFGLAGIQAAPGRPGVEGTGAGDDLSSTEFFQEVARASTVLGSVDAEDVYVSGVTRASSLPAFDPGTGRALVPQAPMAAPDRIVLAAPIKFGLDPFVGVLVAEIDRRSAAPFLASSKGNVRDVYLIDRSGTLISRAADPGDVSREFGSTELVASALDGSLGVKMGADPIDGATALVASAHVPDTGWVTLAVRTATAADAAADSTLQQQRLAGGGLAVVLVLGSLLVGVASSRSIRRRDALAESLAQQTAVAEVLASISRSAFDLKAVLDTILERAVALSGADSAQIGRVEGDWIVWLAGRGPLFNWPADTPFPVGRARLDGSTLAALSIRTGTRQYVEDASTRPELPQGGGPRTRLAVPLVREGKAFGTLMVFHTEVRPFSDREMAIVETFADQAAIAMENVRLFNETKEALEQQTGIAELLKTISRSAYDLDAVLHTIIERAAILSQASVGAMFRLEGDWFVSVATYGPVVSAHVGHRMPSNDPSLAREATRTLRTQYVEDVAARPDLPREGARTRLAVPIVREGRALGVLLLGHAEVRTFTDREQTLVQTFADQAAIAIENVRLFTEIQEKSAQLAEASRHKSEFLANMSHELRTPLNAIIGFSDVLLEGMSGELLDKQRDYIQDIRSSGQHQLALINDILDLSKVEAGRMELELAEVPLASVVDEALLLVRERAGRHGITVAVEVAPDLPPLSADARKLKQAVLNLVTNAVKFTPDGGWVSVTARREADDAVIAVRDTGVGIAADDQARIFEEFRQAKRRDGSVEGTGLGLALTKRIVELHGGRISLESEVGKGSTFTVRIPLRPAPVAS